MAKKAAKRKTVKNPVKKYAKSHGFTLPHGYEVKTIHKVVKKKK